MYISKNIIIFYQNIKAVFVDPNDTMWHILNQSLNCITKHQKTQIKVKDFIR